VLTHFLAEGRCRTNGCLLGGRRERVPRRLMPKWERDKRQTERRKNKENHGKQAKEKQVVRIGRSRNER
jgi:hypothetical protein